MDNRYQIWQYSIEDRSISDHMIVCDDLPYDFAVKYCNILSSEKRPVKYYTRRYGEHTYIISILYVTGKTVAHSVHYNEVDATSARDNLEHALNSSPYMGPKGTVVTTMRNDNAQRLELEEFIEAEYFIGAIEAGAGTVISETNIGAIADNAYYCYLHNKKR